jgi:hypothetical protein
MEVKDIVTGNMLSSTTAAVVDSWKANPDRFVPVQERGNTFLADDAPKQSARKPVKKAEE